MSITRNEIVSSDEEPLILVDAQDRILGHLDKAASHDGAGILHRAFSLFVFNHAGKLLVQQRAADKRLWPLFWSNSCCSHPRKNEDMSRAIQRRVGEELGLSLSFQFHYKFEYQATYSEQDQALGSEHELCWVYSGVTRSTPDINSSEIHAWKWLTPEFLTQELERHADQYTPWFKMEWQRLMTQYWPEIEQIISHEQARPSVRNDPSK